MAIALEELSPKWLTEKGTRRVGMGIEFVCPHCLSQEDPTRIGIPFSNPLDGKTPLPGETWHRIGEEFGILTLGDSIRIPGHGTITVTNGEVDWSPFVNRLPVATTLADLAARFVGLPAKGRTGLGLHLRCPHCEMEVQLLFLNPLDGGTPVQTQMPRWHRQGGLDPLTKKPILTDLSLGAMVDSAVGLVFAPVEIDLGEHGTYTIEHGHVLVPGE